MGGGASSEQAVPIVVTPARQTGNTQFPASAEAATTSINHTVTPSGRSATAASSTTGRINNSRQPDLIPVWEFRLGGDDTSDDSAPFTLFSELDHERLETTRSAFARSSTLAGSSPSSSAGSVVVLLGKTAWNVHLAQPVRSVSLSSSSSNLSGANLFGGGGGGGGGFSVTANSTMGNIVLQFAMSRGNDHKGLVQRRMVEKADLHAPSPFDDIAASGVGAAVSRNRKDRDSNPMAPIEDDGENADNNNCNNNNAACKIKLESTVKAHHSLVYCIDFSGDGKRVLSGSKDGSLRYFELDGSRVVCDYRPIEDVVLSCAVSPDSKMAAAGSSNTNAYVYSTEKVRPRDDSERFEDCISTLVGHKHKVYGVKFTHDSKTVVTASMDCSVRTWDPARQFVCTRTLVAHTAPIFALATSPMSSNIVLSGGDDNILVCHDLRADGRSGGTATTFSAHRQTIWACDISADEKRFVSAGMDGQCLLWDARSNRKPLQVVADHGAFPVHCALFMPEGNMVLTSARDSTWRLWKIHPSLCGDSAVVGGGVEPRSTSTTTTTTATTTRDTTNDDDMTVYEPQEMGKVTASTGNIFKLAYSTRTIPMRVMSCGSDGLIKVWNLEL